MTANGEQGYGGHSSSTRGISPDGRFVLFYSDQQNLVPGDTGGQRDTFIRDRKTGRLEIVSRSSEGVQGNGWSDYGWLSVDGRYVAFRSNATNLVPDDTNGERDIFVRDRFQGRTERVSVSTFGEQGNSYSDWCPISADGRFVVFASGSSNLVAGDTNGQEDIFIHDRRQRSTERVSVGTAGSQSNGQSVNPFVSDDGRFVSFGSEATNLVPGDSNSEWDLFVRDRQNGTTERVNVSSSGAQTNPNNGDYRLAGPLSPEGRFVVFWSSGTNLVPGDTNNREDVFVRDRLMGTTERVSIAFDGAQANDDSQNGTISADGRYVSFHSDATNLFPGAPIRGLSYVRDRQAGTTELVSVDSHGVPANGGSLVVQACISGDGRFVTFDSWASNLVPGDTNNTADVFVHDRFGGPGFTSLCEPGVDGVRDCPCANPPGGPGRGCDNSAVTGGAALQASGGTFLSSDSLVFETSGQRSSGLGILMQGNGVIPDGVIYGQGVRCLGGTIMRRLFLAQAFGGSIRVPDFSLGQSTISSRSAAKGDVIEPGTSRAYLVYYRDPVVPGGCPVSSTFNATQTGRIRWSP